MLCLLIALTLALAGPALAATCSDVSTAFSNVQEACHISVLTDLYATDVLGASAPCLLFFLVRSLKLTHQTSVMEHACRR